MFLVSGLDLAAGRGISAVANLETGDGRFPRFVAGSSGEARTDDDILQLLTAAAPAIVAIDAPLTLPAPVAAAVRGRRAGKGLSGGPYTRAAERDPLWSSLGVRPLPVSFLGGLTFRAIALTPRLREALPGVGIIEVFPTATLRSLGIAGCEPRPRRGSKTTPSARCAAQMALRSVIDGIPDPKDDLLGADLLDALAAALTAARHLEGSTQMLGDPREGQIVVVQPSHAGVGGLPRVL